MHISFGRWLGDPTLDGKGVLVDPYKIYTPQQLYDMRNDLAGNYKLMRNIDMSTWNTGLTWTPIGTHTAPFIGTLDGNGKVISNLAVDNATTVGGLFGAIQHAEIYDLTTDNFSYESTYTTSPPFSYGAGVIAAVSRGNCYLHDITITNSAVRSIYASVGGMIGWANTGDVLRRCYVTATVEGSLAGGIIGSTYEAAEVEMCSVRGTLKSSETAAGADVTGVGHCGGIVGLCSNIFTCINSYAAGTINGTIASYGIGGLMANPANYGGNLWDKTVNSGLADPDVSGTIGYTTAAMQMESTYTTLGWNFVDIWKISADEYPKLKTEPRT
jgi:hypothetical protein